MAKLDERRIQFLAVALVFSVYALSVWARTYPVIAPDELGILFQAQWLAGDGRAGSMGPAPYYHIGAALVFAPVFLFQIDPFAAYKGVMLINAALSAAIIPFLVKIASHFGFEGKHIVVAAALVALWPSYFYTAHYAWGESVFRFVAVFGVFALIKALETRGVLWAALFGLAVALAYAAHPRALLVVPLAALVLVASGWFSAYPWRNVVVSIGTLAVCIFVFETLSSIAHASLWDEDAYSASGHLINQLLTARLITAMAVFFGQIWYQIVASLGLIIPGALVLVAGMKTAERRIAAAYVLFAVAGVAVASMGQMLGAERLDHATYGRYIDGVSLVPLWLGFCVLIAFVKKRWTIEFASAAFFVVVSAGVVWLWAKATGAPAPHPNNVAGIGWILREGASAIDYLLVGSATALLMALALLAIPWKAGRILVVAGYVAVSAWQVHDHTRRQAEWAMTATEGRVELLRQAGDGPFYWSKEARHVLGLYSLQYALGERFLRLVDDLEPGAVVLSHASPGADFEQAGELFETLPIWRHVPDAPKP